MSVDREELRERIEALRRELPEGAPIVPVATVRARDRAEVISGRVFELGLASWRMTDPELGAYVIMPEVDLYLCRGELRGTEALKCVNQELVASLDRKQAVGLVCDEICEPELAHLALWTTRRWLLPVLTPTGLTRGIDALARTFRTTPGSFESMATFPEPVGKAYMLATLHETVFLYDSVPDSAPVGMLFVGGESASHARERTRVLRELLRASASPAALN